MRTLLVVIGVSLAMLLPISAGVGGEWGVRPGAVMPQGILLQVTNAGPSPTQLYVDGQFVGTLAVQETILVPVFPGYRYLEWKWLTTGEHASAKVEIPNEPIWQYTIR